MKENRTTTPSEFQLIWDKLDEDTVKVRDGYPLITITNARYLEI